MIAKREPDWYPPENVYVEIDGEDVLIPVIDDHILASIRALEEENDSNFELAAWVRSLRDIKVHAAYQYFSDQWIWETGHPIDKFLSDIFEVEHGRRRKLATDINIAIARTTRKQILERQKEICAVLLRYDD